MSDEACLENTCNECNHSWFDNMGTRCPKCGGTDVHSIFDEPEYGDNYEEDDYEDDQYSGDHPFELDD